jgi:hypothetical protein
MVVLGIVIVGHRFSPQSLGEEHTEALERALWPAIRKLKETFRASSASTEAETEQRRTGALQAPRGIGHGSGERCETAT